MSEGEESETVDASSCCASCGIAAVDDIELKECDNCDLVKYCSEECQNNHKSDHEEACKKRAAELRDELLFKQPESTHLGDCPICSLPLPIVPREVFTMICCSKTICNGCYYANQKRELEARLEPSCLFCREPESIGGEEIDNRIMKRIEANDPVAMCQWGGKQYNKGY